MDYVVAIPSYARAELIQKKTLALLKEGKVPASKIDIFVANKAEEKVYQSSIPKELYGRIIVGKKGISYQRNFIIDYYPEGKHIVFIDDDISRIERKWRGAINEIDNLDKFFKDSFKKLHKYDKYLWTTKNMYNPFYKKQLKEEGHIGLVQFSGDLMGIINRRKMKIKTTLQKGEAEQVELLFRYYEADGGILRFENVIVISAKLTPGGKVEERGSVEARKKDIVPNLKALAKEFPDLVKGMNVGEERYRSRASFNLVDKPIKVVEGGSSKGIKQVLEGVEDTSREYLPIRNKGKAEEIKEKLLEELRKTRIPTIGNPRPEGSKRPTGRADVIGSIGRTITFGFGDTRQGFKEFATNKKHPKLLKLLAEFGNAVVPKGWTYNAITLNEGVKAKKHKDSKNIGRSVIIGIGDYEGGGIKVWDKDDKNPKVYDLNMRPVMFNGGLLFHQTTPFKGERYTIIYYKQKWAGKTKGVPMVGRGITMEEAERLADDGAIFA